MALNRTELSAIVRLLTGIGLFLLMLVFIRACFSPPPLPAERQNAAGQTPEEQHALERGTLPSRY